MKVTIGIFLSIVKTFTAGFNANPMHLMMNRYKLHFKLGCDQTVKVLCKHQNKKQTKTIKCTELPAICFSLLVVDNAGKTIYKKYYRGKNAAERFIEVILDKEEALMEYVEQYVALSMSEADKEKFESATHCQECDEEFECSSEKCRDHNHHTGDLN